MNFTHTFGLTDFALDAYNAGTLNGTPVFTEQFTMEPKFDGFRLIAVVEDDRVLFYTRSMKRQDGKLPHIEEELLATFKPGTVLDGEIVALQVGPDGSIDNRFADVQSVMLSGAAKAAASPIKLKYIVFDMPYESGNDLRGATLRQRSRILEGIMEENDTRVFINVPIRFESTQENHDALVAIGFEGSVVKDLDGPYRTGDRGKGWYKLKNNPEVDVIIMGYEAGRGKFSGMVGAVKFGQPDENGVLVERGQCSGMNDTERMRITQEQDELLGTVITITHMGVQPGLAKSAKFRHPQFNRFRPDKPASEVHWHDH